MGGGRRLLQSPIVPSLNVGGARVMTPATVFLVEAVRDLERLRTNADLHSELAVASKEAGGFAAKLVTQSSAKNAHQRGLPTAILVVEGVPLDFLKIIVSEDKLACLAVDSSLHTNNQILISAVVFGGRVLLV